MLELDTEKWPRIVTFGLGQKNGVAVNRGLVSDSVDNALRWFELLLGRKCIVRPYRPWDKSVISLGIGPYVINTASGLRPSVYKSRRDLYLVI